MRYKLKWLVLCSLIMFSNCNKKNHVETNNLIIENEQKGDNYESIKIEISPPNETVIEEDNMVIEEDNLRDYRAYFPGYTDEQIVLLIAIHHAQVNDVKRIISSGLDLSLFNQNNYSPLYYNIESSYYASVYSLERKEDVNKILKILLEAGCDPNIGIYDRVSIYAKNGSVSLWYIDGGITPLMMSIMPEVIQILIDYGADINYQDEYGRTALMLQSFFRNNDCIELLVKNGADTNIKDKEGRTALFYAIWGINVEGIKILINYGTDINVIDNKGFTPLDIAHIRSVGEEISNDMKKILSNSGAKNKKVKDNTYIIFYRNSLTQNEYGYGWWPEDLHITYGDR